MAAYGWWTMGHLPTLRLVFRAVERGAHHAGDHATLRRRCIRGRERDNNRVESKRRRRSHQGHRPPDDRRPCREGWHPELDFAQERTTHCRQGSRDLRLTPKPERRRQGRQGRRTGSTSPSSPTNTAAAVRRAGARVFPADSSRSCATISRAVNGSASVDALIGDGRRRQLIRQLLAPLLGPPPDLALGGIDDACEPTEPTRVERRQSPTVLSRKGCECAQRARREAGLRNERVGRRALRNFVGILRRRRDRRRERVAQSSSMSAAVPCRCLASLANTFSKKRTS